MIRLADERLTIRLDSPSRPPALSVDDLSAVLSAVSRFYRLARMLQFSEATSITWPEYTHYQDTMADWFEEPTSQNLLPRYPRAPRLRSKTPELDSPESGFAELDAPERISALIVDVPPRTNRFLPYLASASQTRVAFTFAEATEWVGGVTIESARSGSTEAILLAIGGGTGVAIALRAAAFALQSVVQLPGLAIQSWQDGQKRKAELRLLDIQSGREQVSLDLLRWAAGVVRGGLTENHADIPVAVEILTQAGIFGRRFSHRVEKLLEADITRLAQQADEGKLLP